MQPKKKPKLPVGVVVKNKRWYVRVRYQEGGKRHAVWRECAKNPTDAKEVRLALLQELGQHGHESIVHAGDTFEDLAKYYETRYLIEAQYVDGKKVAGRRNLANPKSQLKRFRSSCIADLRLRAINYEVLKEVRLDLFNTPTRKTEREPEGHQRSQVDVNRHMQLLRHMLKVARRLHWMHTDPFADAAAPLVTPADEKKRRRVMSFAEETALLAQCVGPRKHLRLIIVGLVDTLMRSGEFFKLRVRDLAFDPHQVTVEQMNTKTLTARAAPMSARFSRELKTWFETQNPGPEDRVFPFPTEDDEDQSRAGARRAWSTAKRLAGVTDLRLKDLRRTGATRLLRGGMPIAEISRILGHTSVTMTYEYIGLDVDTTSRAVEILDALHEGRESSEAIH